MDETKRAFLETLKQMVSTGPAQTSESVLSLPILSNDVIVIDLTDSPPSSPNLYQPQFKNKHQAFNALLTLLKNDSHQPFILDGDSSAISNEAPNSSSSISSSAGAPEVIPFLDAESDAQNAIVSETIVDIVSPLPLPPPSSFSDVDSSTLSRATPPSSLPVFVPFSPSRSSANSMLPLAVVAPSASELFLDARYSTR